MFSEFFIQDFETDQQASEILGLLFLILRIWDLVKIEQDSPFLDRLFYTPIDVSTWVLLNKKSETGNCRLRHVLKF